MLKDLFSKIKNFFNFKKETNTPYNNLITNQKLILHLRKNKNSGLKQLKYISKILTKSEKKIISGLFLIILLCLGFIGSIFAIGHIKQVPADKGDYNEGLVGAPRFINPLYAETGTDNDLVKLIFSGLLKYDKDLKLKPDLAENYEINKDQTVYLFHLRKNVTWHNGDNFTADDVVFTIDALKNKEYHGLSFLYSTFKAVTVNKLDDYSVEFILPEPYAPFLNTLTFGILPKNIWADIPPQNASLAQYNLSPIGTGMFIAQDLKKDKLGNIKAYTLKRNDNYYGEKTHLQNLIFTFYDDFDQAYLGLKSKEVQGLSYLPKNLRADFTENQNIVVKSLPLPQYTAIFFNQDHNDFLKEKKARLALNLGINKSSILEKDLSNEAISIYGPILPGYIGYNPNLEKYDYNPQEANKVLDDLKWVRIDADKYIEAGKKEMLASIAEKETQLKKLQEEEDSEEKNNNIAKITEEIDKIKIQVEEFESLYKMQTFYRQKDGKLLKISLTTIDSEEYVKIANSIKDFWKNLGVYTELNIVNESELKNNIIKTREYDCLLYGEIIGADPDPYPFWHSSQNKYPGLNLAVFSDKDVDKLLEEARQTNDLQVRNDKYIHFQNILVKEIPTIFLYTPTYSYLINKKVKGFDVEKIYLPQDRFANIEEWYIKTKRVWQ